MDCSKARIWLLRRLDGELAVSARQELDAHLSECGACAHEDRLLSLPRRIGRFLPVLEPSPYFYRSLRARLEEAQTVTIWQILFGLSRQVVPALAMLTLVLLSVFAYMQLQTSEVDVYQAYDRIFTTDRPHRMVIADQGEITDESVLQAITEEEPDRSEPREAK
jgi:predicted anti-sigma-YlaC factor YlaD